MELKNFTRLSDVQNVPDLVEEVIKNKSIPNLREIGRGLNLALLFFNPSLRTRLSSQRAAQLLGMDCMVMDVAGGWPLEFEIGKIMDGDKSEHVIEAAGVVSQYADIIGIRSFPLLKDRDADYSEPVINAFLEFGNRPVVNLESGTGHPLQALADLTTIREFRRNKNPRILLTWAPHPKALPQAVANSFASWTLAYGYDLTICHPEGYELDEQFTKGATIEYDPIKAYQEADFVYAKNWSSFRDYGQIKSTDSRYKVDLIKMKSTNQAYFMHCLPVRRNVIVDDAVIDGPYSLILAQAKNRTYAALSILKNIIEHMNK